MSDKFYDQPRLMQRLREYQTLVLFIVISAILAVLCMDVLVLPVTLLAINNTGLYTSLVKIVLVSLPVLYIIMTVIRFFRYYRKEGLRPSTIVVLLVRQTVFAFIKILLALLIIAAILIILYAVFYYNNYLIYKLVH